MAGDTPVLTTREKVQSFLIANSNQILQATGRNAGFPDDTGASVPGESPLGPPSVAITRVIADGRQPDGSTTIAEAYDIHGLINAFTPKTNIDFLDVPNSILNDLAASVKIYKMYPWELEPDRAPFPVKFEPNLLSTEHRSVPDTALTQEWLNEGLDAPPVGITGLTVKRLGGNPAEVESNIQVSISLYTTDLNNLFYRYVPQEVATAEQVPDYNNSTYVNNQLTQVGTRLDAPSLVQHEGVAWIDLIKMNPARVATDNLCDRKYDEFNERIMLEIGWYKKGGYLATEEIKDELAGDEPPEDVCAIWENAKKFPDNYRQEYIASAKAACTGGETVVDEDGTADATSTPIEETTEQKVARFEQAITTHKEKLYLSLKNHEIIVNPDMSVTLTIHFIAFGEMQQRSAKADLLGNPTVSDKLYRLTAISQQLEKKIDANQIVDIPEGADEEAEENLRRENESRDACLQTFNRELEAIQEEYADLLANSKNVLWNQLRLSRLGEGATSRVYTIAMPKTWETAGDAGHIFSRGDPSADPLLCRYRWCRHTAGRQPLYRKL